MYLLVLVLVLVATELLEQMKQKKTNRSNLGRSVSSAHGATPSLLHNLLSQKVPLPDSSFLPWLARLWEVQARPALSRNFNFNFFLAKRECHPFPSVPR